MDLAALHGSELDLVQPVVMLAVKARLAGRAALVLGLPRTEEYRVHDAGVWCAAVLAGAILMNRVDIRLVQTPASQNEATAAE